MIRNKNISTAFRGLLRYIQYSFCYINDFDFAIDKVNKLLCKVNM